MTIENIFVYWIFCDNQLILPTGEYINNNKNNKKKNLAMKFRFSTRWYNKYSELKNLCIWFLLLLALSYLAQEFLE